MVSTNLIFHFFMLILPVLCDEKDEIEDNQANRDRHTSIGHTFSYIDVVEQHPG